MINPSLYCIGCYRTQGEYSMHLSLAEHEKWKTELKIACRLPT
ncbi:DUF1289 domain-containing protein [Lelliottia nimipressuralis]|uniref:DUF1289 domain-containing protein n=1 Tax=Lelliottia nimipressuralis TaxID=69220 RepID=A0ABY3P0I1_9ENTR|nr:DUF1289 domain-containing protein [Lelliottia nimipressuralis]TYT31686.1 DUF1289 domain-containing protein [Lelliottia nimipressuralis]